jgi:hypothetical protein
MRWLPAMVLVVERARNEGFISMPLVGKRNRGEREGKEKEERKERRNGREKRRERLLSSSPPNLLSLHASFLPFQYQNRPMQYCISMNQFIMHYTTSSLISFLALVCWYPDKEPNLDHNHQDQQYNSPKLCLMVHSANNEHMVFSHPSFLY